LEWLHKYEIPYFGIHFVHDKHLVDCDIYIDDSPQFIDLFNENGKKVVICDHRWNQSLIGYDRVGSFNDFAKNILEGKYE
jgi:5'(3')-deoxyribonucleotidase